MRVLSLAICLLLLTGVVFAQGTAQINGNVKDQTGAVLPVDPRIIQFALKYVF